MRFHMLKKCVAKSVYLEWPGSKRLPLQVLLDNTDEVPHPIMSAIEQIIVQFISHGPEQSFTSSPRRWMTS